MSATIHSRGRIPAACILLALAAGAANANVLACTNADLVGSYGYQEQGQALGAGFSQFRSVGRLVFNGNGIGSRVTTIWYSDFEVVPEPASGITYAVQPDCRFTFSYANGETFAGVIVDGGQKLFYLETGGDPSRSGQAERQAAPRQ